MEYVRLVTSVKVKIDLLAYYLGIRNDIGIRDSHVLSHLADD